MLRCFNDLLSTSVGSGVFWFYRSWGIAENFLFSVIATLNKRLLGFVRLNIRAILAINWVFYVCGTEMAYQRIAQAGK